MAEKTIVIGVCGGIAVYKVADLVSKLAQKGYNIEVIMTEAAQQLVAPLTFRTLSGNPVRTAMFREHAGENVEHIALADRADLMVVVPATANMLGKVAGGIADDLLSTTIMAADCPVIFFPAMNVRMWENTITQENISRLRCHGYDVVEPDQGHLACGTSGKGRLLPVAEIEAKIIASLETEHATYANDLGGTRVLVSAGPTVEHLDPVRYLSNRSSGKMGYAIAAAAQRRGARVDLVSGPVHIEPPVGVTVHAVESAAEMQEKIDTLYNSADIVVMAAAVADYRAKQVVPHKIKKGADDLLLTLEKTPDILAGLGRKKQAQFLVGFAAESNDLEAYAKKKIAEKNLDMIVANDVLKPDAGFDVDTNIITIYKGDGHCCGEYRDTKEQLAHVIWDEIIKARR